MITLLRIVNCKSFLDDYPSLERKDILACLDYVAALAEEQVTPIEAVAREKRV